MVKCQSGGGRREVEMPAFHLLYYVEVKCGPVFRANGAGVVSDAALGEILNEMSENNSTAVW